MADKSKGSSTTVARRALAVEEKVRAAVGVVVAVVEREKVAVEVNEEDGEEERARNEAVEMIRFEVDAKGVILVNMVN